MGGNLLGILTIFHLFYCNLAYFNLFLSKAEVKRLLGLEAELFYVREGVTNEYASGWTVKVPPTIQTIHFQWQSLVKKKIKYDIEILVNKTALAPPRPPIFKPTVNIPLSGIVPKDFSSFDLNIPCTGYVNAELDVLLNINVSAVRKQAPLVMYLRRRKICHRGLSAENFQLRTQEGDVTVPISFSVYFLATLLTVVLVMSAFFSVIMFKKWILSRHQSNKAIRLNNKRLPLISDIARCNMSDNSRTVSSFNKQNTLHVSNEALYCIPTTFTADTFSSFYSMPKDSVRNIAQRVDIPKSKTLTSFGNISDNHSCRLTSSDARLTKFLTLSKQTNELSYDSLETKCLPEQLKHLQMDRKRITLFGIVEEGSIGQIYAGYLQREHPEMNQKIIIKTVKGTCSSNLAKEFVDEGIKLSGLRNVNILCLVGISFIPRSPPLLIYPDANGTNLQKFLRSLEHPLKINEIVHLSIQASNGIAFLHANNIVHRDVAARNCIVCQNLQLKICDSSLSPYLFPADYISEDALLRPLRWLAPECILSVSEFSFASDVWSLGVLLWEIATNAEEPYEDISWWRILPHLQAGFRLRAPTSVCKETFAITLSCWTSTIVSRPSASEINNNLLKIK